MTKSPLTTPVSVRMYYISSLRWHLCFLNKLLSNVWVPWVPILWIEPFFYNLTNTKTTAESLLSIRMLFQINTRTVWNLGCCGLNFISFHFIPFFSFFSFTSIPNSLAPPLPRPLDPVIRSILDTTETGDKRHLLQLTLTEQYMFNIVQQHLMDANLRLLSVPSRWSHGHSSTKHYGNGT